MQVKDIMTDTVTCCSPDASVQEAAEMMAVEDCGEIPVVDATNKPIGVITDRDITCRVVAKGKDATLTKVREVMSTPVITVAPQTSIEECCRLMEENQIRRVPVINEQGVVCGIVAQADIALRTNTREAAELVQDVSRPNAMPSRAGRPTH